MMQHFNIFAVMSALVGLCGCASGGTTQTSPVDDAESQAPSNEDGGTPKSDGAAVTPATDAATPTYVVSVVIDGVNVAVSDAYFGRGPGSEGYFHLGARMELASGYTFRVDIIGIGGYPSIGIHDPAPTVTVEMYKSAERQLPSNERENWRGDGAVRITAAGADSNYEGSSTGTLTLPDSPFFPPLPPGYKPRAYAVSWKGVGKP